MTDDMTTLWKALSKRIFYGAVEIFGEGLTVCEME
jgi:hypothetical protein